MEVTDTLVIQSECLEVTPAEPEPTPVLAPAEEMIIVSYRLLAFQHKHFIIAFLCLELSRLTSSLSFFPFQDAAAEQTCRDMLSEEPKPEICDISCQMQLNVESVETSVEATLNGHIVPEVSIEG